MYLQLPCPLWHQWRVHAWVFVTVNFSHMAMLLTCYVHHLSARQLHLNRGSSKWKWSASCPTEWSRESRKEQCIHSFSLHFIFFLILPNTRVGEWMVILFHLFACPTNMSFWKILYVNQNETFLKDKKMSSALTKTHLSSPPSCSCLSGLQRKHCRIPY